MVCYQVNCVQKPQLQSNLAFLFLEHLRRRRGNRRREPRMRIRESPSHSLVTVETLVLHLSHSLFAFGCSILHQIYRSLYGSVHFRSIFLVRFLYSRIFFLKSFFFSLLWFDFACFSFFSSCSWRYHSSICWNFDVIWWTWLQYAVSCSRFCQLMFGKVCMRVDRNQLDLNVFGFVLG